MTTPVVVDGGRHVVLSKGTAILAVVLAFVAISVYTSHIQTFVVTRGSDGKEYFDEAQQIAAGQTIRAETPYAYRIALPWLVARTFPDRLEHGFRVYNVVASAVGAGLLLCWLFAFSIRPGVAVLTTTLYIANWIGPARFLFFYPEYVDPPFIAFTMGALLLMHSLRRSFSWERAFVLGAVCFAGAFVRETMLIAPIAFLFANVRVGRPEQREAHVPILGCVLPLAFGIAGLVLCHQIHIEPRRVLPPFENALMLFRRKALFTLPLAFFMTFGPIIAVVLHDWRAARDLMARHVYLAVFFAGCFGVSYLLGHETERYLIWAAPVAYLLIAVALQNHGATLMRRAWVFVPVVIAQALASHVFFGIPDTSLAVGDFATLTTTGEKIWGVINRLVIVDDFSWNIWSYFGSRPFHALLLAIYAVFSALLITYLRWAERPRVPSKSHI